jgi:hypothetical protein
MFGQEKLTLAVSSRSKKLFVRVAMATLTQHSHLVDISNALQ